MTTLTADLESLWDTERERLVRYMQRRVGVEQAEDLVQALFLRAWAAICNGTGATEHIQGYLSRSAHNAVIDFYRLRNNAPEFVELDAAAADFEDGAPGKGMEEYLTCDAMQPDELALQAETVREVRGAMRVLTDEQRFVIEKRMDGHTIEEISTMMGKSALAVKQLHFRGYETINRNLPHPRKPRNYRRKSVAAKPRAQRASGKFTRSAQTIQETLLHKGPMGAMDIMRATGVAEKTLFRTLKTHTDVFVVVGKIVHQGGGRVYGIAGVHDQEAA